CGRRTLEIGPGADGRVDQLDIVGPFQHRLDSRDVTGHGGDVEPFDQVAAELLKIEHPQRVDGSRLADERGKELRGPKGVLPTGLAELRVGDTYFTGGEVAVAKVGDRQAIIVVARLPARMQVLALAVVKLLGGLPSVVEP